ncbi:ABC transporter ATP-binding protein [Spirochaetota bacterium]|nr:ABC transporter ATP-binding protein [Spirochaetota bacterium]
MRYIFSVAFKREKLFVSLVLFVVFIASVTTLGQAVVAANLLNSSLAIGRVSEDDPNNASRFLKDAEGETTGIFSKIINIFYLAINEGNDAATKYVIDQRSLLLLIVLGFALLIILATTQVVIFGKNILISLLSLKIALRIRALIFNKLLDLPSAYFRIQQSGGVVYRLTDDARVIENNLFRLIENGFFGPVLSLCGLGLLIYLDYRLTLLIFLNVIVTVLIVNYIATFIRRVARRMAEGGADINTHVLKVFATISAIKVFCREKWERRKYRGFLRRYLKNWLSFNILTGLVRPVNEIVGLVGVVVIIFYGTVLIWRGELTSEGLFTFLFVLLYIVPYFERLSSVSLLHSELQVSVTRILEIVNSEKEVDALNMGNDKLLNYTGRVEFKNVSFDYSQESAKVSQLMGTGDKNTAVVEDAPAITSTETALVGAKKTQFSQPPILDNISFKVAPCESIGLVGESGSGKTTLVNLIALFMSPTKGAIFFDGKPVTDYTIKSVRRHISMVSQETYLFNASILENVQYGRLSASYKEVREACRLANIDNFVASLEDGYNTHIGESGVKLSGGQKQRIALARALLKNSKILMLDEATSALDSQNELEVQRAIEVIMNRQTTFIIAHRFSTILKVNRIMVLDKGKIVQFGTHEQLMKQGGLYRSLYNIQFNREVAAGV